MTWQPPLNMEATPSLSRSDGQVMRSGQQMTCSAAMLVAAWRNVSGAAHAELVALGIGQDEPVAGSLADVHLPRAEAEQPV